ncbi:MAG TPA: 3D domain-containing protein [Bryobacteraceae bacterium]|nr:3D domain-containing protein [Bryobacteraceae bacterium]
MHKNLLVVLSLLGLSVAVTADEQRKQPKGRFAKAKQFVARAYSSGTLTALGKKPIPGLTIAADPKVLPLGATVHVGGAGEYSGVYQVGDTGGAIKGNKIDVFVASRDEAIQFGKRLVHVSVLRFPKDFIRAAVCRGCAASDPEAIMNADAPRGSDSEFAGRSLSARRAGNGTWEGDTGQGRGTPAFYSLSAFERSPAY